VFGLAFVYLAATLLVCALDAYLAAQGTHHAERLAAANAALKRAQDELESRVAERTAALAQTAASLREQIAERGRADERIRESERRFSAMLANVQLMSLMFDRDARIT